MRNIGNRNRITHWAENTKKLIFDFSQKYHVKTTHDTTQMTFRAFQAKLGPVKFFPKFFPKNNSGYYPSDF